MDTDLKREEGSNSRLNVKLNNKSLMERNQYEVRAGEQDCCISWMPAD